MAWATSCSINTAGRKEGRKCRCRPTSVGQISLKSLPVHGHKMKTSCLNMQSSLEPHDQGIILKLLHPSRWVNLKCPLKLHSMEPISYLDSSSWEHIDWYGTQDTFSILSLPLPIFNSLLFLLPSLPPSLPPILLCPPSSSKEDVWVWIIDSDTCYMLLGVIICSGECRAARYEKDTTGIKRHNQDLKTATLPKITCPSLQDECSPKPDFICLWLAH